MSVNLGPASYANSSVFIQLHSSIGRRLLIFFRSVKERCYDKIGLFTFSRRSSTPTAIGISQIRFQKVQWKLFLYNVCKFSPVPADFTRVNGVHPAVELLIF